MAKLLRDYARGHQALVVKGGLLGDKVVSAKDVEALADLPPRDVLLAQLAGAFQAPMVKLAGLLQALPRNFAYGLARPSSTSGGGPRGPTAEPATEAEHRRPTSAAADREPATEAPADAPAAAADDGPREPTPPTPPPRSPPPRRPATTPTTPGLPRPRKRSEPQWQP